MMDTRAVKENLREWLKNPSWAEYYNGAPSDRCREFIALEFYYSEYVDGETAEEMDRIEGELGIDDLRHLMAWCGNNPRKVALARKIREMKEKQEE